MQFKSIGLFTSQQKLCNCHNRSSSGCHWIHKIYLAAAVRKRLDACEPANYRHSLSALMALSPCCVCHLWGFICSGGTSSVLWGVTCVLWGVHLCLGGRGGGAPVFGGGSSVFCGGIHLCFVGRHLSFVEGHPCFEEGPPVFCGCRGATPKKCSRGEERARGARGGSQPCQAHMESACSHGLR